MEFCRSSCSALIYVVSFSAAVVQSWRALHTSLLKTLLHHRYFPNNFSKSAEQQYWKMHLTGFFWGRLYFGNISEWLLKVSCKDILIVEILAHISHFLLWRHVKEEQIFMDFFLSKGFGQIATLWTSKKLFLKFSFFEGTLRP